MGSWSKPCGGTGQRYSWPWAGCCWLASPPPPPTRSRSLGWQVVSSTPCSPGSTTKSPRTRSPPTSTALHQTHTEPLSTATGLPLVPAEEPLVTKTRTRTTRIRTRSHATVTVPPAMSTVPRHPDMGHLWTATEPPRLSMVPQLPITERPATRLRWRPTNQWSPMLPPPSATRPPQLTQPPPPLTIMPHQAQVMELQAMATAPPALGMELQTVPAEGLLVTKIRTRIRTRSRATVMEPLSVTTLRLATSTASPADRATRTEEASTSLPSSLGVGTRRMTKTRTKTRPLVMKTAMHPHPTIPPPTKLSPTNRLATRCTRPIILQTTRTSAQSLTLRSAQR